MPIKDVFLASIVPMVWAIGLVISKPAMEQLPPILLNAIRWGISGTLMFYFFPFPRKIFKELFLISFIGCTIQYSLTFSGLRIVDASSAILFIQSEIPFGIIVAFLLLGERTPLKNIIGLVIAFIGIFFLSGSPDLEGKMHGVLLILLGSLFWAFAQILAKPISKEIGGLALTAWLGVFCAPQCLIASYFIEGNTINYIMNADLKTWIIVLYLGLIMNVLGYSIWYTVLSRNPANYVMPVLLLFPVTGLLTSILILGETPNSYSYIGGAIIVFGVSIILINIKKLSK